MVLRPLVLGVLAASLMWPATQNVAHSAVVRGDPGLCWRAPAQLVLPPERERAPQRTEGRGGSRAHGAVVESAPTTSAPPPPPPPPSVSADESAVVTGSRIPRADAPTDARGAPGSSFDYRSPRPPGPGMLTAGDHDDLLNPALYARYVDGFAEKESLPGLPRVDTRNVLTLTVRDDEGRPAPFASVTLTCADGNRLTLATTADGAAVFFPELDHLGQRVSVSVRTRSGEMQNAVAVTLGERNGAQRRTITVAGDAQPVRNFDLALVVDTTGSMGDELEYLKAELVSIVDDLNARHPGLNTRVALVVYRDLQDDYITRTFPFTSDVHALQAHLSEQYADGGGDYPEAVEQAMARAVALNWRPDAVHSILFVADAPPHADDVVSTWRSTLVARDKRIQIVPVGASGVGPGAEYLMRAMAALTQSRYIFLTDDSGIGNPHAPPSVDCYLVTKLGTQIRRVLDAQISGHRVEPPEQEIIRTVGDYDNGRCRN